MVGRNLNLNIRRISYKKAVIAHRHDFALNTGKAYSHNPTISGGLKCGQGFLIILYLYYLSLLIVGDLPLFDDCGQKLYLYVFVLMCGDLIYVNGSSMVHRPQATFLQHTRPWAVLSKLFHCVPPEESPVRFSPSGIPWSPFGPLAQRVPSQSLVMILAGFLRAWPIQPLLRRRICRKMGSCPALSQNSSFVPLSCQ